ncbi:hypothetical protein BDK51DRAFT_52773, partial [Blyttiomyces helicus]
MLSLTILSALIQLALISLSVHPDLLPGPRVGPLMWLVMGFALPITEMPLLLAAANWAVAWRAHPLEPVS